MEPASEFLVHGSGPAAALASARLARARLPVRWHRGNSEPEEDGEGEFLPASLLARLPGPEKGEPPRRIALRRWLLLDGDRYSAVEFREPSSPEGNAALLRSELAGWCTDAARNAGVVFDRAIGRAEENTPIGPTLRKRAPNSGATGTFFSDPPASKTGEAASEGAREGAREWYSSTLYDLPSDRIDERFALASGEGAVLAALAAPKGGVGMGGCLRTYRKAVGLGVLVWGVGRLVTRAELTAAASAFQRHPAIAPFLEGSTAHPSTVREIAPAVHDRWGGPGYLRIGRGAGLEATNGMESRGLAAELASAEIAAEVAAAALRSGPRLGDRSSEYRRRLGSDPVYEGFRDWAVLGARLKSTAKVWSPWPGFAAESFERLMTETGAPKRSVRRTVEEVRRTRKISRPALLRSAWNWWEGW
ncbi:MAG: hypothetical protein L3K13_08105 [Thermoplasmata archaeon]|nr:hypothetical protein [Thermoplasmata archaeon]